LTCETTAMHKKVINGQTTISSHGKRLNDIEQRVISKYTAYRKGRKIQRKMHYFFQSCDAVAFYINVGPAKQSCKFGSNNELYANTTEIKGGYRDRVDNPRVMKLFDPDHVL
jgi:hypothetical protein